MRTSISDRERSNSCASNSSGGSTGGGSPTSGNSRPHSVCDIVKAGYLHIKRPPTSGVVKIRFKTWQRRYFVLRDESYDRGTALLDIFTTESGWHEEKTPSHDSYTIDLHTVKHVDEYTESKSFPNAFTITRTGQGPLIMGADSDYDVRDWIVAIQLLADKLRSNQAIGSGSTTRPETARRPSCPPRLVAWNSAHQLHGVDVMNNNDGNGRNSPHRIRTNSQSSVRVLMIPQSNPACTDCSVKVQGTESSRRNGLSGEYNMVIQGDDITLRRMHETRDVIKWSIGHIRKFKSEDMSDGLNIVTLDANVHCGLQSGTFLFVTSFGRKLIQRVKESLAEHDSLQHRDPGKDLARLRTKALNKAPSTPNLLSRGSPPKLISKTSNTSQQVISIRERTQSNPEQSVPKPNSYLDLLPEELPDTSQEVGNYVDDQLVHESTIQPVISLPATRGAAATTQPMPPLPAGTSPKVCKKRHSGLPPLPPSSHQHSVSTPVNLHPSSGESDDRPPVLPPRRPSSTPPSHLSGTPPHPPPRPQHTLSTNSLPV